MCVLGGIAGFKEEFLIYLLNMSVPEEFSGLIRIAKSKALSYWIENMVLIAAKPLNAGKVCAAIGSSSVGNESQSNRSSQSGNEPKGEYPGRERVLRCFNCNSDKHLIVDCPEPKKNRPFFEEKSITEKAGTSASTVSGSDQ